MIRVLVWSLEATETVSITIGGLGADQAYQISDGDHGIVPESGTITVEMSVEHFGFLEIRVE
ncbi:MAG: hypothetical protein KF716_25240 [Anaerolineae bacterium]|nr:hypothetical protein [Anaerolineae bacterium]